MQMRIVGIQGIIQTNVIVSVALISTNVGVTKEKKEVKKNEKMKIAIENQSVMIINIIIVTGAVLISQKAI